MKMKISVLFLVFLFAAAGKPQAEEKKAPPQDPVTFILRTGESVTGAVAETGETFYKLMMPDGFPRFIFDWDLPEEPTPASEGEAALEGPVDFEVAEEDIDGETDAILVPSGEGGGEELDFSIEEEVGSEDAVEEETPLSARDYFDAGLQKMETKALDEAILNFQKAVDLDPDFAEAHHKMGLAYKEKGDYEASTRSLTKAIELKPRNAVAYYDRGLVYFFNRNERSRGWDDILKARALGYKVKHSVFKAMREAG